MTPNLRAVTIALLSFTVLVGSNGDSPASSATWVDDSIERRAMLQDLLLRGEFDKLDTQLAGYQSNYESGQYSDAGVSNAFYSFWTSDAAMEPKLLEWVAAMPRSYAARLALGTYYSRLGWLSRGLRYGRQTSPEQFRRMDDYFDLARMQLAESNRLNDRVMLTYALSAGIAKASGQNKQMAQLLKAGLAKDPASRSVHQEFIRALDPQWGGSIEAIEAYLGNHRPQFLRDQNLRALLGHPLFLAGNSFWDRKDYHQAASAYTDALGYGEDGTYLLYRGQMRYRMGQFDDALKDLERASCRMGNPADAYLYIGYIRAAQRDGDNAFLYLDRAVQADPRNPNVLIERARQLTFTRHFEKALADFDAALDFGSHDPDLYAERRNLFHQWFRLPEAIREAEQALRLNPRDSRLWMDLAESLTFAKDCRAHEAFSAYQQLCANQGTCLDHKRRVFSGVIQYMRCNNAADRTPEKRGG